MKSSNQDIQRYYKQIPRLKISPSGVFKYILIKCFIKAGSDAGAELIFVRGSTDFEYHAENFDSFCKELKKAGFSEVKKKKEQTILCKKDGNSFQFVCVGGGRIEHKYGGKNFSIYGYSQSFGHVDHQIAGKIVSEQLGYPLKQMIFNQKDY